MSELKCPNCKTNLEIIKESDIEYEKCPTCQSVFLDKGELNLLITGRSGNIELSSSISEYRDDKYNGRICPKCQIEMGKAQLLNFSSIYFNCCDKCGGFFLDNLTDKRINNYLQHTTKDKTPEEFRAYIKDILIRVDIEEGSSSLRTTRSCVITGYTQQNNLLITAYYKKPLNIDLFITKENLIFKLSKILFNKSIKESKTGNINFDNYFKIHSNEEYKLMKSFNDLATNRIMDFISKSPCINDVRGKLFFYDDRVVYKEGSYIDIPAYKDNDKFAAIFNDLVEIVKLIK